MQKEQRRAGVELAQETEAARQASDVTNVAPMF